MAEPKKKKVGRPPSHGETSTNGRSGKRLSLDIDPVVRDALDEYCTRFEQTNHIKLGITAAVQKALIEMLERADMWPVTKPSLASPASKS